MQKKNKSQIEENDKQNPEDDNMKVEKIKKIKKSILVKRQSNFSLINNPAPKFMYKLSDASVIHEDLFRNTESCYQSLIMCNQYFKRVASIQVNQDYITLNFRSSSEANFMPVEYFVKRLQSFQDQSLYDFAQCIQEYDAFHAQTSRLYLQKQKQQGIQSVYERIQTRNTLKQLRHETYIQKFKGKCYFSTYYTDCRVGFNLAKIVVSLPLLQALGIKLSEVIDHFTKYKKVNFEVLSSHCYKALFSKFFKKGVIQKLAEQRKAALEGYLEPQEGTAIKFTEQAEVYRKKYTNDLQWQQKVKCNLTIHKTAAYFSVLEINDIEDVPLKIYNSKTREIQSVKFNQMPKIAQEIQTIKASTQNSTIINNNQFKITQ